MCPLDFYTTQILTSATVIIECFSWLIKVIDNDAQWKPEIRSLVVKCEQGIMAASVGGCDVCVCVWTKVHAPITDHLSLGYVLRYSAETFL